MEKLTFEKKLSVLKKRNLALIGHMGSGKSVLGHVIAKQLNINHIDTDEKVSKYENSTINDIFLLKGEAYFRNLESKIVTNSLDQTNIVLSLGGGAILSSLIRDKLKKNSITLFFDVSLFELEKRLKKSNNRPLLKNVNIREKVKELDIARRKYYLLSDIIIQNTNSPIDTCKNFIEEFFNFHEKTNFNKNQKQEI